MKTMMVKKVGVACAAVGLALIVVCPASAQSSSKVGIAMSSASAVGVYIPVGDRFAIRPQMVLQRTTTKPSGAAPETTQSMLAPGVALLLTLTNWDSTRVYASPQYVYSRATADTNGSVSRGVAHVVNAMIGAQNQLGSRFAVFGEVGLSWSKAQNTLSTGVVGTGSRSWTTRSTIGGILFF